MSGAKELRGQKIAHPFSYFDKGNMAVVERLLTWLVWAFVHILSLPQLQQRLRVQRQWLWSYFTDQRSSRLIPELPRPGRTY